MNFDLSEEQRMLESTIDGLLAKEFPVGSVREFYQTDAEVDPTLWKSLAELGVLGLHLPETYGGAGLALLDLQCVAERLGYHATPGPFLGHVVAGLAISLAGSEAQKTQWLPRLASGDAVASVAFAEPGDRWQPEQWTLAPSADGALTGTKRHVEGGRSATCLVVGLDHQTRHLQQWTPTARMEINASKGDLTCKSGAGPMNVLNLVDGHELLVGIPTFEGALIPYGKLGPHGRCVTLLAGLLAKALVGVLYSAIFNTWSACPRESLRIV